MGMQFLTTSALLLTYASASHLTGRINLTYFGQEYVLQERSREVKEHSTTYHYDNHHEVQPIPSGWTVEWSETKNKPYWFHETGDTQWVKPVQQHFALTYCVRTEDKPNCRAMLSVRGGPEIVLHGLPENHSGNWTTGSQFTRVDNVLKLRTFIWKGKNPSTDELV